MPSPNAPAKFEPCPICASTKIEVETDYPGSWSVYCEDCLDYDSFSSHGNTCDEAIAEWNLWAVAEADEAGAA